MTQVEFFFSSEGPLAKRLEGYVPRTSQIAMALAVEKAISTTQGRLVVEAGTGTGKSLAYLVAALLADKKVLISTATRALQDQLFHKDLPLVLDAIAEYTGQRKYAVLMKGRSNYLCLLRSERFSPTLDLFDTKQNKWLNEIRDWSTHTTTGDKAELSFLPEDSALWGELNARGEVCLGGECPLFSGCFVTHMRKRAEAADVIVANHSLFCAERTLKANAEDADSIEVLPPTDVWIFDEAHAFDDVATRHFGVSLSQYQVKVLTRDLAKLKDIVHPDEQRSFVGLSEGLFSNYCYMLDQLLPPGQIDVRSALLKLPLEQHVQEALDELKEDIRALQICLIAQKPQSTTEKSLLQKAGKRLDSFELNLKFLLEGEGQPEGYVTFIEKDPHGSSLTASPVDVANILQKTLWNTENPVIMTSATLAIQDNMTPFLRRVGLSDTQTHILPAPFDYPNQAGLYLPKPFSDPLQANYLQAFCTETAFLINMSKGGAFVLFTSYRAMQAAYDKLKQDPALKGLLLLKQGDGPKLELLKNFVQADATTGAVLFATHSFWEGVDVRGKALRLVIIDRLPFKVPDDPVTKARVTLMERKGLSAFAHLSLPEAALALKQGVGRLLRTIDDAGIVAILDSRIVSKGYGQVLIKSLPPMRPLHTRKEVTDFWQHLFGEP